MDRKALEEAATRILRKAGYTAGGRRRGTVSRQQCRFEKRMRPNPFSGRSIRRRK